MGGEIMLAERSVPLGFPVFSYAGRTALEGVMTGLAIDGQDVRRVDFAALGASLPRKSKSGYNGGYALTGLPGDLPFMNDRPDQSDFRSALQGDYYPY